MIGGPFKVKVKRSRKMFDPQKTKMEQMSHVVVLVTAWWLLLWWYTRNIEVRTRVSMVAN